MSSENWKEWVTTRRQEYSQRLKSAQLTNASESSSLGKKWATPAARDYKDTGLNTDYKKVADKVKLGGQVMVEAVWPTPTAAEGLKIGSQPNYGQVGLSNHPAIVGLPDREKLNKSGKSQESWPTPTAMSRPRSEETMEKCLKFRQSKGKNTVPLYLEEKVRKEELWATPTQDGNYNRKGASKHSGDGIATQVQNWPTPRETMSRDVDHDRGKGNLGEKVQSKGMKLNPNWVEQLMGLPVGWTQLPAAWID
jgi:hypothetical protein